MTASMLSLDEVRDKIISGKNLLLAGDEALLRQLPAGNWIAGTQPYFMTDKGGLHTQEQIHVTELPDFIQSSDIQFYDETSIPAIYTEIPENGISFIIIPAGSAVHYSFALNAPNYENFAFRPLVGWITGSHLDDLDMRTPKIFNGRCCRASENAAIVMHVKLPKSKVADIGIINIFVQGDGDSIVFPRDGFSTEHAYINGKERNFRDYLIEQNIDTRRPLVADYYGVSINTSIRPVEQQDQGVSFFAPVFSGLCYKHARPIADCGNVFATQLPLGLEHQIVFSCNCILNYFQENTDNRCIPRVAGLNSFGEIAYLLMNQTMVYVRIIDIPARH
ncbi:MAG: hypothetical protein P8X63_13710 [Desulfuromonadaceae bacterium]|jgi:hypothetical protein